jgi:hypothetical protein
MQKKYLNFHFSGSVSIRLSPLKGLITFIFLLTIVFNTSSQGIAINTTGVKADASAILDMKSSNKGFLVPRMTTAQISAINAPANSLIVFNTTSSCYEIYLSSWLNLACVCSGLPATPGTITPSNASPTACSTGITYSIAAVAGATSYNWTVPTGATITAGQGTTSITVTWASTSGHVTVTALNSCGTSGIQSLSVTLTNGSHGTVSYSYTGSPATWTVPACVSTVTITINGAGGGSAYSDFTAGSGGLGAMVKASLAVIQNEVLNIYLGQVGANSNTSCDGGAGGIGGASNDEAGGAGYGDTNNTPWYNLPGWGAGGGGGGASSIRVNGTAAVDRVIVAGGGGGAGADYNTELYGSAYGIGGNGGQPGTNGAGYNVNERGKAGSAAAGGAAVNYNNGTCTPNSFTSTAGGFGYGGDGGMSKITCEWGGGGGGGGGYYGGSGGCGGGGGGGYSYTGGTGVTTISITAGSNAGSGSATIAW